MTDCSPLPDWWDLENPDAWRVWKDQYLAECEFCMEPVELRDPARLSSAELQALSNRIHQSGGVVYRTVADPGTDALLALGKQLGLHRVDYHQCAENSGVARLTARNDDAGRFIPYTRHRLRWHTDGYYQPEDAKVWTFLLHCHTPAESGGVNRLLDPRALYCHLREEDPAHIDLLTQPNVFEVPAHEKHGTVQRAAFHGAVFSMEDGHLYMRYTERDIHIHWDPAAERARDRIRYWLDTLPQARLELKLEAGCGLIAHNLLHCRSAYTDHPDAPRLLYRIRYLDRVNRLDQA